MVSCICIFEKGPPKLGKHALHDLADSEDTVELLERSHTQGWADREMPQAFRPLLLLHTGCDVLQKGHCMVFPL